MWDAERSSEDSSEPKISLLDLPGHLNSALVGDLKPHVQYKARVYAENSLGRGEPSSSVTVKFCSVTFYCRFYFSPVIY